MAKDDVIEMTGTVIAAKGNGMFEVELEGEMEGIRMICTLGGKIKKFNIKIIEGSQVKLEISVYDTSKGRIVYRIK